MKSTGRVAAMGGPDVDLSSARRRSVIRMVIDGGFVAEVVSAGRGGGEEEEEDGFGPLVRRLGEGTRRGVA